MSVSRAAAGQEVVRRRLDAHARTSTFVLMPPDDPRMNADWRKWAGRGGNPIVELAERTGSLYGAVEIVLEPER